MKRDTTAETLMMTCVHLYLGRVLPDKLVIYSEAATKSLQNAESWINDAAFLIRNHSFGHARALAAFALEEIAKCQFCWMASWKLIPFESKILRKLFRGAKAHSTKNQVIHGFLVAIMFGARKKLLTGSTDTPTEQEIHAALDFLKIPEPEMEKRRQRAIYVDLVAEENRVSSPGDIERKDAEKTLQIAESFCKYTKRMMEGGPPKRDIAEVFGAIPKRVWDTGIFTPEDAWRWREQLRQRLKNGRISDHK